MTTSNGVNPVKGLVATLNALEKLAEHYGADTVARAVEVWRTERYDQSFQGLEQ